MQYTKNASNGIMLKLPLVFFHCQIGSPTVNCKTNKDNQIQIEAQNGKHQINCRN